MANSFPEGTSSIPQGVPDQWVRTVWLEALVSFQIGLEKDVAATLAVARHLFEFPYFPCRLGYRSGEGSVWWKAVPQLASGTTTSSSTSTSNSLEAEKGKQKLRMDSGFPSKATQVYLLRRPGLPINLLRHSDCSSCEPMAMEDGSAVDSDSVTEGWEWSLIPARIPWSRQRSEGAPSLRWASSYWRRALHQVSPSSTRQPRPDLILSAALVGNLELVVALLDSAALLRSLSVKESSPCWFEDDISAAFVGLALGDHIDPFRRLVRYIEAALPFPKVCLLSAFHHSMRYSNSVKWVERFYSLGVPLGVQGPDKLLAIQGAAFEQNFGVLKHLCQLSRSGQWPTDGDRDLTALITVDKRNLLILAVQGGNCLEEHPQDCLDCCRLLISLGVPIDSPDELGRTAFAFAAARTSPAVLKLLAEHGANVNCLNKEGQTPYDVVERRVYSAWGGSHYVRDTFYTLQQLGAVGAASLHLKRSSDDSTLAKKRPRQGSGDD